MQKLDENNNVMNRSFSKKWEKKLPEPIEDTKNRIEAMSDEEIKKKIVAWTQAASNCEKDLDADPRLESLKQEIKEIKMPYVEAVNHCLAQARFGAYVLETRGK